MVKNLLLLLFFFHLFYCSAQSDFYYLNDSYYKGTPKRVTTSTFFVQTDSITNVSGIIQKDELIVDIYSEDNKCIRHLWKKSGTETTREFRFNYDEFGNRTEFIIFGKDSILKDRYLTLLDSDQNEISHETHDSKNDLVSKTFTIKSIDSLKETTVTMDSLGAIESKNVTFRDAQGREIKTLKYHKNWGYDIESRYTYNEYNKISEYLNIGQYNDTVKMIYKYDSLGREIEYNRYEKNRNQSVSSWVTIFRDSINQSEYHEYENGRLTSSNYQYLDSNDCLVKLVEIRMTHPTLINRLKDSQSYETETHYVYDQYLNWIEKTQYYDGKMGTIQKRTFEYY